MRRAFEVKHDSLGNVPPLPAIFPDQMAPAVRMYDGERELLWMRWGFPPAKIGTPPQSRTVRSRIALPTTLTDDNAIAAAAMIGESRMPKNG